MADYSRRPRRNHRSLAKYFSSVFSKDGGVYDDVLLTRAPKVAAATNDVRDYAEIFGASKSSSIPFLELDDQFGSREEECWSSKLDYMNVFGQMSDENMICSRKIDDSLSFVRGSDRSKALEGSQQLNYDFLFKKKHNISHEKITREGNDEAYETSGEDKKTDISVSVSATDGTLPLKSVKDSASDAEPKKLLQCCHDVPVEKYSRIVSSDGLSKHEADGFIEIDVKTGYEYGSDRSVFCDSPMVADIIKFEEHSFDVITPSALVLNLGSPNVTFKDQVCLGSNSSKDSSHACTSTSRDGVKAQSLGDSFVTDSAIEDDPVGKSFLTQDHGGECATLELLKELCSISTLKTAKGGSYNSQQDVKLQSLVNNQKMDSSVATPQDSSELTLLIDSQHDVGKLNTVVEVDSSEKIVLGNAYIECDARAPDVDLTKNAKLQNKDVEEMTSIDMREDSKVINLKSLNSGMIPPSAMQCNLGNIGPAVKNATILQSGGLTKSTFLRAKDHSTSSSNDKIDKNSEAAIYVSAVKIAMQEAQVWISVAKESDGVKGFMKPPVVERTFGQVKAVKEVHNYKVKDSPNFFELGQPTFENNCSKSSPTKAYIDPWSTKPDIKLTPSPSISAGKEITFREPVFFVSHEQNQKKNVAVDSSLEDKAEVNSALQFATPCNNILEEKLALYNNEEEMKSIHGKGDTTILCMADLSAVAIVEEAYWYEAPKVGKTESAVMSTDSHDSFLNDYGDNNTFTGINEAENEPQETLSARDQSFEMRTFPDNFDQCQDDRPAIDIELKDLVSITEKMTFYTNQNEVIKADRSCVATPCSDDSENDLTSWEEEIMKETKQDPPDEGSDYEDFQDYASAKESLDSIDSDDEIYEKDSNLPSQFQFSETEDIMMQNMTAQEAIMINEDVSTKCFSNLHDEQTNNGSHESEDMPLDNKVSTEEMTVLSVVNSAEESVESNDSAECMANESNDMQLQNMMKFEIAPEDLGNTFLNNSNKTDLDKQQTDVFVDLPVLNMVTPEAKDTGEIDCNKVEVMLEHKMAIPDKDNIYEKDIALPFENSNVVLMVAEIEADTNATRESRGVVGDEIEKLKSAPGVEFASKVHYVCSHSDGSEVELICKGSVTDESEADKIKELRSMLSTRDKAQQENDTAFFCDFEPITLGRHELCDVVTIEAEIIEKGHEASKYVTGQEDPIKLESTPLYPECDNHEVETGIHFSQPLLDNMKNEVTCEFEHQVSNLIYEHGNDELESVMQFCEPHLNSVEDEETSEFEQQGDKLMFEHVNSEFESGKQFCEPLSDNLKNEGWHEFEQLGDNLIFEKVNHEVGAGIQFFNPLSDKIMNEETTEFEQQGENLSQLTERHERKKWEIPKESFELPKLKVETLDLQDTAEKSGLEVKSLIEKHERKKWEIPVETFELPVLDDDTILEESEDIVLQDQENNTKSAAKPERKKWKIQKDEYEVPLLSAEVSEQTSRQDRFVVITEVEEVMSMTDKIHTNLMDFEETCQHVGLQNEISANVEAVVPSERDSPELCDNQTQERVKKEHSPDTNMLYQEEKEKQLNDNSDQQDSIVEKGKSDEQGDFPKVLEDINVKEEIKRTLGMFWKRIYKSKQDEEFESVEFEAQEETFTRGVYMDLNLTGPVELVESPRQQDDIHVFNFSEQSSVVIENTEDISYVNQLEVNESKPCSCEEFISTTGPSIEVQKFTTSVADSGKLEAVGDKSCAEEKCEQKNNKCNENDQAAHSEDMQSSNGSEEREELAQNHEPDESQQGNFSKTNISPSDVNESHQSDSEVVSKFEALLPDDSLLNDAENTRKVKLVIQDEELNYGEMVKTTLKAGARSVTHGENYFEDGVVALLGDVLPDRFSTGTEQQDSNPISFREVASGMPSHEPKVSDKEEECGDKSNEQDDELEINLFHKEKENIKKEAGKISTRLTRKEELIGDHPSRAEDRTNDCLHNKVTVNKEVLESILRAKERERRVVKRVIREARERAFAEARERAAMEKAKVEASQDESINGQEWLQTASSEAKLATEENSIEAKRKGVLERAAVERATVEARQRALEKAMSQKEQTSHDSSSSSNGASNDQYGSCSRDGISYDNSSESALRFKVMTERDQQIAERAAKALEEKNMRDLLVQREQAERNRLAEVLDADFKKWAKGKTGNLRALLSTLQYVLGPDSGWQPISLIDIVTTDAVKKAYRKATLFLHPDKLQQRSATIKQKYICEKVFDLLKEAWNRFDREER